MEIDLASWKEINLGIAALVLVAYIVTDGLYAYYTLSIQKRNAFASANTSVVIHFLLAFGVLTYVENFYYIIPIAIGSWIGTFLVVRSGLHSGSEKMEA